MDIEQNKKTMGRFVEFINTGNLEIGREIIAPDAVFYAPTSTEPLKGLDGYAAALDMMRGAMPDIHWTPEEMISEGDNVVIRFTMSGTQTRPFMGIPATGKPIRVAAINIYRLRDGKIVLERGLPDLFSMLAQLGAVPSPSGK